MEDYSDKNKEVEEANNVKKKFIYGIIAIVIWILLFILPFISLWLTFIYCMCVKMYKYFLC